MGRSIAWRQGGPNLCQTTPENIALRGPTHKTLKMQKSQPRKGFIVCFPKSWRNRALLVLFLSLSLSLWCPHHGHLLLHQGEFPANAGTGSKGEGEVGKLVRLPFPRTASNQDIRLPNSLPNSGSNVMSKGSSPTTEKSLTKSE